MLATSAAPFASWDPWGKIAGTRKIGQICAKGISSKDPHTRALAFNLFDVVLFKQNGLLAFGEDHAAFRKLARSVVEQLLDESRGDVELRVTPTTNLEPIFPLLCLANLCNNLFDESTKTMKEDSTRKRMRETLVKEMTRKKMIKGSVDMDKRGSSSKENCVDRVCDMLDIRVRQLTRDHHNNSFSLLGMHHVDEIDQCVSIISSLSNLSDVKSITTRLRTSTVSEHLYTLCVGMMWDDDDDDDDEQFGRSSRRRWQQDDELINRLDPFVIFRALSNIVSTASDDQNSSSFSPKIVQYVHDRNSSMWSWLSSFNPQHLTYVDELGSASIFGLVWGALRSTASMTRLNATVRGGRLLALGRTSVRTSLGAMLLTSVVHLSKEFHQRVHFQNNFLVVSSFSLERMIGIGMLAFSLFRISPYSFFPVFVASMSEKTIEMDSSESGGFGGNNTMFSFKYEFNGGDVQKRSDGRRKGGRGGGEDDDGSVEV